MFSNLILNIGEVVDWISNAWSTFAGIFSDINFTILYSWLPSDIANVITACIVVLLFLALIALIKRIVLFLG